MKNIRLFLILLLSPNLYSQDLSKINSDLNLPDSLNYKTEVRIYQGGGITNSSSLLRMFKDKSNKWTAEFYEHYDKVAGQAKLRTKKQILKSKNDMEFVYLNLIRSNILHLPNQNDITWKLKKRGNVEKIKRKVRGEEIEVFDIYDETSSIVDGVSYEIEIQDLSRKNNFEFYNPESYLKMYPEVDELIYVCEILEIIKTEFGVWKN